MAKNIQRVFKRFILSCGRKSDGAVKGGTATFTAITVSNVYNEQSVDSSVYNIKCRGRNNSKDIRSTVPDRKRYQEDNVNQRFPKKVMKPLDGILEKVKNSMPKKKCCKVAPVPGSIQNIQDVDPYGVKRLNVGLFSVHKYTSHSFERTKNFSETQNQDYLPLPSKQDSAENPTPNEEKLAYPTLCTEISTSNMPISTDRHDLVAKLGPSGSGNVHFIIDSKEHTDVCGTTFHAQWLNSGDERLYIPLDFPYHFNESHSDMKENGIECASRFAGKEGEHIAQEFITSYSDVDASMESSAIFAVYGGQISAISISEECLAVSDSELFANNSKTLCNSKTFTSETFCMFEEIIDIQAWPVRNLNEGLFGRCDLNKFERQLHVHILNENQNDLADVPRSQPCVTEHLEKMSDHKYKLFNPKYNVLSLEKVKTNVEYKITPESKFNIQQNIERFFGPNLKLRHQSFHFHQSLDPDRKTVMEDAIKEHSVPDVLQGKHFEPLSVTKELFIGGASIPVQNRSVCVGEIDLEEMDISQQVHDSKKQIYEETNILRPRTQDAEAPYKGCKYKKIGVTGITELREKSEKLWKDEQPVSSRDEYHFTRNRAKGQTCSSRTPDFHSLPDEQEYVKTSHSCKDFKGKRCPSDFLKGFLKSAKGAADDNISKLIGLVIFLQKVTKIDAKNIIPSTTALVEYQDGNQDVLANILKLAFLSAGVISVVSVIVWTVCQQFIQPGLQHVPAPPPNIVDNNQVALLPPPTGQVIHIVGRDSFPVQCEEDLIAAGLQSHRRHRALHPRGDSPFIDLHPNTN